MSIYRQLLFVVLGILLFLPSCSQTHSHPPSIVRRVSMLMTDMQRRQDHCYAERHRYCSLDELSLPTRGLWGEIHKWAPTRVRFLDRSL